MWNFVPVSIYEGSLGSSVDSSLSGSGSLLSSDSFSSDPPAPFSSDSPDAMPPDPFFSDSDFSVVVVVVGSGLGSLLAGQVDAIIIQHENTIVCHIILAQLL